MSTPTITAFAGFERIAQGSREDIFAQLRQYAGGASLLIFDDTSGALVDLDLREPVPDAAAEPAKESAPRSVGRPKLGVVAREVTLLPRHWDWLSRQPGGASVALRRLVEEARRVHHGRDAVRESREAAYRFMTAMAGALEGFEEAARALFAGDKERFSELTAPWPVDVSRYLQGLAAASWSEEDAPS
ncbi:MAG: DUF2239 family protein [Giesbergeria sp.]